MEELKACPFCGEKAKAEQMFNKLGFTKSEVIYRINSEPKITYEKPIMGDKDMIYIEFRNKCYALEKASGLPVNTPTEVHEAIHQQLKELGWIK